MRLVFLIALLFPGMTRAATLTTFDYPGAKTTCASAIASNGAIAGVESDGTLNGSRAFIFINDRFSLPKPAVPAGTFYFTGIDKWLDLVGTDLESAKPGSVSFLYARGETTTQAVASLNGVTDSGTLLGAVTIEGGSKLGYVTVAFTQAKGGKRQILNDHSLAMAPSGIDPTGTRVVGTSLAATGGYAWSYFGGIFTPLAVPGATLGTQPHAVDSKGDVRGYYVTGTEQAPVAHGFLYEDGAYQTYDVPGATSTQILAANEAGQFAGCYSDKSGTHGFYATP